jgi:soluble lytic murein transglycosylase-like protein
MHGMVKYVLRILYPQRRHRLPFLPMLVMGGALVLGAASGYARPEIVPTRPLTMAEVAALRTRADHVAALYGDATGYIGRNVLPLEHTLLRQRDDSVLARQVAVALVRQSNRLHLNSHLLLGVLLVENPTVVADARSRVGARGLMQIMPEHVGNWACGSDLDDVATNICYGAHIFRQNLQEADGDLAGALLRYNGCVNGTNTPDCKLYPRRVLARAARVRAGPIASRDR